MRQKEGIEVAFAKRAIRAVPLEPGLEPGMEPLRPESELVLVRERTL